jgi:hypothetical protein
MFFACFKITWWGGGAHGTTGVMEFATSQKVASSGPNEVNGFCQLT